MKLLRSLFLALTTHGMPCAAWADGMPPATPYRPTLSNPAELSAPGWLEIEAGWLRTRSQDVRRQALSYTAKLAFDEDWGILIGGEAHIREATPDFVRTGFGDTSVTVKRRFATGDEDLNFGVEAGIKSPTAHTGLGSGKSDWTINGIASLDFASSWRIDANVGVTRLGAQEEGLGRNAALWAASLSRQVDAWNLAVERSGTHQHGSATGRQWLVAASHAVTPQVVMDIAVARNRQGDERQNQLMFGFTWLTARLF